MSVWLASVAVILILAFTPAGLLVGSGNIGGGLAYASPSNTIYRTASGLIASDSLTTGNTTGWGTNGSAATLNAPRSVTEDSNGMHVGVSAPFTGQWAGYFAITPLIPAHLYHAKISLPNAKPTDGGLYNVAVYVQQEMFQDPRIDAMGCGADVSATTTTWTLTLQAGDKDQEIVGQHLYDDNSPNPPLTRECTLVTNGDNQLTAYLDGVKVFSSNQLNLNMPQPFQYYLETQSSSASPSNGQSMFVGTFTDYYSTTGDSVKIRDAGPTGSIAKIVDATSGNVIASGVVDSSGTAMVNVAAFHMPINANVQLFDSSGANLLATTASPLADIYGGDVFDVGTATTPSVQVTVNAVSMSSGSPLDLYTTVSGGSSNVPPGFSPYTFSVSEDGTYFISVSDYQNNVFDHWDDGTRFASRTITPTTTSPLNLTAYFRDSSASPLGPPSSLTSLTQYTTNSNAPTIIGTGTPGASIQVYDGQNQIAATPSAGGNTWAASLPALAEGRHLISATQSISSSGGTSVSPFSTPITMAIDNTPPSVAITSTKILQDGRAMLSGTASDFGIYQSGIKSIQIGTGNPAGAFVWATPNQPGDWSTWSFTTAQPLSTGSYHFTAMATDLATNQASNSVDLSVAAPPGQSIINVSSIDNFGSTITGMYTLLNQNGTTLVTGFTPVSFNVADGTYTVAVADFNTNLFDHWQTGAGNVSSRSIPVTVNNTVLALTAVYKHPPTAPSIGASPNTIVQGQSSSLTSTAMTTGVPPFSYQWLQKGPSDNSFAQIIGATSPNYTFATTNSTTTGSWSFELQVTDNEGATATTAVPATVNVNPFSVTTSGLTLTCASPIDLGGASSCNATVSSSVGTITGEKVSFAQVSGSTGSVAFNGGTTCTLMSNDTCTLGAVTGTSSGGVTIQATYPGDSSNGPSANTAVINVNPALVAGAITPSTTIMDKGQSGVLTANPSGGTGLFSYKWYSGSSGCTTNPIAGATLASFTASPTVSTSYYYRVTDSLSQTACSAAASVTVNPVIGIPKVTPSATTITIGQSISAQVTWTGGTPSYTARLYSSNSNSTCNSNATLVASVSALPASPAAFTSLSPSSTLYYCASITDGASMNSTKLSAPALVTVKPKDNSTLTLTIGNVVWGGSITLTGKLTDTTTNKVVSGATVTFATSSGTILPLNAVTNSIGVYKVSGTAPNAVGTWQVTAHFAGDSVRSAVDKTSSYTTAKHRIQLTLSVPLAATHGQTYNVTGTLIDLSANNVPVANATITFTATRPITIHSTVTDSNGKYLVGGLVAPSIGTYTIQASYAANALYNAAGSGKQIMIVI